MSAKNSSGDNKVCNVCKVPYSLHVRKPGPGKCFGGAFTTTFQTLLEQIEALRQELKNERREARDREAHLTGKLKELTTALREERENLAEVKERMCCLERAFASHDGGRETNPVRNQKKKQKKKRECGGERSRSRVLNLTGEKGKDS